MFLRLSLFIFFLLFCGSSFSQNSDDAYILSSKKKKQSVSSFIDGPHYLWLDSLHLKKWEIEYDRKENSLSIKEKLIEIKKDSVLLRGFYKDKFRFWSQRSFTPPKSQFSNVSQLLVVGDVHGEYLQLVKMLTVAKVIDKKKNWIYGSAHLVFIGDIFDRGSKVTECLWLIHKLEIQAKQAGGRVHFILGNHEIMILLSDTRYVSNKYSLMSKKMMFNYFRLYSKETYLGRWLRSLNSIIKINDIIFVHAGLSSKSLAIGESLDAVNDRVRSRLALPDNFTKKELYEKNSIFWYRGYFHKNENFISADSLFSVFGAKKIVFGHSEVSEISYFNNNSAIGVNVPFGNDEIESQLLLIENGEYYRVFSDGVIELLK